MVGYGRMTGNSEVIHLDEKRGAFDRSMQHHLM
jgi:hypothetical protein